MKRIIILIICILLCICSSGYASETLEANSYSDYELVRLYKEVSHKIFDPVKVPAGLYVVGKDLPSGFYTVLKNSEVPQSMDNDFCHVAVFSSMEEYKINPDNLFDEDSHALIACNTFWNGFSYELTDGMVLFIKMGKAGITRHSKNLFAVFWADEGEKSSTVDLTTILNSGRSERVISDEAQTYDSKIIVEDSNNWTITKKYEYNDRYGYYCFVVFKHSFLVDQNTTVSFTFYDNYNNIVGVVEDNVGCTGCDYEYIASGRNKTEYKYVVVSFSSKDLNRTTDCMDGIKISSSREDLKIIVNAENIGDKPISSCKLNVLYFDANRNVVDSLYTYLNISYSDEMQKGDIINQEINKYSGDFDSYELYYNACNYGK